MNSPSLLSLAILLSAAALTAQTPNQQRTMPPDYRGVQTVVPGIFVTPIPNAPFTATVDILSHEKLPNGTENVRTTSAQIARDSSGRIYNERRVLVPVTFKGQPPLLSAHIYDPATRLSIFLNPQTRLAREQVLRPAVAARQMPAQPPVPGIGDPWGIMDNLRAGGIQPNHGVSPIAQVGSPTSNPTAATALNNPNRPQLPQVKRNLPRRTNHRWHHPPRHRKANHHPRRTQHHRSTHHHHHRVLVLPRPRRLSHHQTQRPPHRRTDRSRHPHRPPRTTLLPIRRSRHIQASRRNTTPIAAIVIAASKLPPR